MELSQLREPLVPLSVCVNKEREKSTCTLCTHTHSLAYTMKNNFYERAFELV